MPDLPEHVYLVTVDSEWPVSAIADCHPSTPAAVEREVTRRRAAAVGSPHVRVRVWKARLTDIREVDLMPSAVVGPSLRERDEVPDGR